MSKPDHKTTQVVRQNSLQQAALFALTYVSHQQIDFSETDLALLVDAAGRKNALLDITGYLCYFGNSFVQYLEGDEARVKRVMDSISRDRRHNVTNLVEIGAVTMRRFPTWRMRMITADGLHEIKIEHILREMLMGLSAKALTDDMLKGLLVEVINNIAARQSLVR